jgi:hypothetical protein
MNYAELRALTPFAGAIKQTLTVAHLTYEQAQELAGKLRALGHASVHEAVIAYQPDGDYPPFNVRVEQWLDAATGKPLQRAAE